MKEFIEAATVLDNDYIKEWKKEGKKVIGYTCSYVPDEILHAVDILPYRLRGIGAMETTVGDTYFGPFVCSLPKCMLQLAGEGKFSFLDGAIITPGCDSMRRLDECWRKAGTDIEGVVPDFFFHYGVPHKYTEYTIRWFTDETRRFIRAMEEHFGTKLDEERLKDAIRLYNRSRDLLKEFNSLRYSNPAHISGADAMAVIMAGTTMPRDIYIELLEKLVKSMKKSGDSLNGRKRLMLVGSANDDIELVQVIEGDKAIVVADNLCFSARFQNDRVDEDGEPIDALARMYLAQNDCPRMYGDYNRRLEKLKDRVDRAEIDGVILQNIRFCDLHGAENGLFEKDLEAAGIPCVKLEREYGPLVETGRMRMRIDAFLERLA